MCNSIFIIVINYVRIKFYVVKKMISVIIYVLRIYNEIFDILQFNFEVYFVVYIFRLDL